MCDVWYNEQIDEEFSVSETNYQQRNDKVSSANTGLASLTAAKCSRDVTFTCRWKIRQKRSLDRGKNDSWAPEMLWVKPLVVSYRATNTAENVWSFYRNASKTITEETWLRRRVPAGDNLLFDHVCGHVQYCSRRGRRGTVFGDT